MTTELQERVAVLEASRIAELKARDERAKQRKKNATAPPPVLQPIEPDLNHVQFLQRPIDVRSFIQAIHDGAVGTWEQDNPTAAGAIRAGLTEEGK